MNYGNRNRPDSWPRWLEALRPDPEARARMRAAVLSGAAPLLAARRRQGPWEVASGWASVLVPLAACLALLLGWLALRSPPITEEPRLPAMVEVLAEPDPAESPPVLLTSGSEPSAGRVLSAAVYENR